MVDINHLAKLREGVAAWNAWRAEYPGITPDLRDMAPNPGEQLLGATDDGPINLSDALLNGANLHGAMLMEARLDNADLRLSNLSMTRLAGADLSFANLIGAVLDEADLENASMWGAMLGGARLDLALNLTQAQIDAALGNGDTVLPPDLQFPAAWRAYDPFSGEGLALDLDSDFLEANPQEVLGLEPKARAEDIRAAYLRLAKKYHPDVNPGDLVAERRFKKVNEAYHLLTAPHTPRTKGPKPRRWRVTPWSTAMTMFVVALAGTGIAVYWQGMPPFNAQPRETARQVEPSEPSADAVAVLPPNSVPSTGTEYTGAIPGSPPVMTVAAVASVLPEPAAPASVPEPAPAHPEEAHAAIVQEPESQRIKTASDVRIATPPPSHEWLTVGPPRDASSPFTERMAALQPASPTQTEKAHTPWDDEWAGLRGSNELLALHSFIRRYHEKPPADEARGRFRTLVAGLDKADELRKFVSETAEDSPEKAVVQRQLALLVEKETAEGDQRAWNEIRERASIAALRAYLLGFPTGKHVDQAEERLAALEEEATGRKKESAAWGKALRSATRAGYEAYLKAYPDGRKVEDAKRKIAALSSGESTARKEDEAWAKADKERTRSAYYAYLNLFPNGRYAAMAQESIEASDRAPQAEPSRRTAADTRRPRLQGGPRWPSSDEPFVERIQGSE